MLVKVDAKLEPVDSEASEENGGPGVVDGAPHLFVEDPDHGERDHGQEAEPKHNVVLSNRDLSIQLLVVCTDIRLLYAEHIGRSEQDEDAVVHLLADDSAHHRELVIGADILPGAVVA